MGNKLGYEQQQNLSFAQILAEVPSFVAVLVSAILSRNLLVFIDLFVLRNFIHSNTFNITKITSVIGNAIFKYQPSPFIVSV